VTQVRVLGLVSDQGLFSITAEGRALGQASDPGQTGKQASDPGQTGSQAKNPGQTGTEDEWITTIDERKWAWIYKVKNLQE
jgi:hypothetical protein